MKYIEYKTYDNLNIDEEIEKINNADLVYLHMDATSKNMLFFLGVLFAANKKIIISNSKDLNLNETKKSFDRMAFSWYLEDARPSIPNNSDEKNIFIICPVRKATKEQVAAIREYKKEKEQEGYNVFYPSDDNIHEHTDNIGYKICVTNATAIGKSNIINIYYDSTSRGTLFDFGVAYYFEKPIKIVNEEEVTFNEEDFGDDLIKNWPFKLKKEENIRIYRK